MLGIAAMCTAFPCLLAVGEALARHTPPASRGKPYRSDEQVPTKDVFESFYPRMRDKSWLIPPDNQTYNDAEACTQLMKIRHGLAHAVSLPSGISLIRRTEAAKDRPPGDWKIIVPAFVDAIEQTIAEIEDPSTLDLCKVVKYRKLVYWDPADSATSSSTEQPSGSTIWG